MQNKMKKNLNDDIVKFWKEMMQFWACWVIIGGLFEIIAFAGGWGSAMRFGLIFFAVCGIMALRYFIMWKKRHGADDK